MTGASYTSGTTVCAFCPARGERRFTYQESVDFGVLRAIAFMTCALHAKDGEQKLDRFIEEPRTA